MNGFRVSHIFVLARLVLSHVIYSYYNEWDYDQSYILIRMNGARYILVCLHQEPFMVAVYCEVSVKSPSNICWQRFTI